MRHVYLNISKLKQLSKVKYGALSALTSQEPTARHQHIWVDYNGEAFV